MAYRTILTENNIPFKKTCNCGGVFTEVFENSELDIQVRVHPRARRNTIIKESGRVKHTVPFDNINLLDELLKSVIQSQII